MNDDKGRLAVDECEWKFNKDSGSPFLPTSAWLYCRIQLTHWGVCKYSLKLGTKELCERAYVFELVDLANSDTQQLELKRQKWLTWDRMGFTCSVKSCLPLSTCLAATESKQEFVSHAGYGSTNYPEIAPPNQPQWKIEAPPGYEVELKFVAFDIQQGETGGEPSCRAGDFINIIPDSGAALAELCGTDVSDLQNCNTIVTYL